MGPIWGRQDPGGPHVGPMNFAIWDAYGWPGEANNQDIKMHKIDQTLQEYSETLVRRLMYWGLG